jgi:cell division protein FtsB
VGLLRADRLDPDILEELARRELGFAQPNDLVLLHPPR